MEDKDHSHSDKCGCGHDHDKKDSEAHDHKHEHTHTHTHDHNCDHNPIKFNYRWLISLVIVVIFVVVLRPFLVDQLFVRVTSYSAYASYDQAIRMCNKILFFDKENIRALTSLGFSYMDIGQKDEAIKVFGKVLQLNPQDQGAASFELGSAYFSKQDYAKAITYFERIKRTDPHGETALNADILRYRHGAIAFKSLHSMQSLLSMLGESYKQIGNTAKAQEVQKEYDVYNNKNKGRIFI